jgi:hypothetical protein
MPLDFHLLDKYTTRNFVAASSALAANIDYHGTTGMQNPIHRG